MKGGVHNTREVIWANNNVLWTDELACNFSDHDELEKYKWKAKEVGFLGVVIGPGGIKIKEEKMRGVLDWPTL